MLYACRGSRPHSSQHVSVIADCPDELDRLGNVDNNVAIFSRDPVSTVTARSIYSRRICAEIYQPRERITRRDGEVAG